MSSSSNLANIMELLSLTFKLPLKSKHITIYLRNNA